MMDHGVTLPNFRGAGSSTTAGTSTESTSRRGGMLAGLDRNDPNVRQALAACRALLVPSTTTTTAKRK
jgi:hypothetical protein